MPTVDHDDARTKVKMTHETESHGTSGPIKTSFGDWSAPVDFGMKQVRPWGCSGHLPRMLGVVRI